MTRFNRIRKYYSFFRFKKEFEEYSLKSAKSYELVLHWLHSKFNRNQFLLLSGILVGCTAGLAGVLLKSLVHYIHYIITDKVHFQTQVVFYLIFPFLGIVLTTLTVIWFFKGQSRKGIPAILHEIAQNSSKIPRVKMYSQIVQSAITVGLGGSAGLESPIAVTGAALGSNYAQTYQLDYKERTLLLAAGATAGIAAAFNAPIAGMMFAFEILLTGVVFTDFLPLIVAAVCGSLLSKAILQEEVLFHFESRSPFNYHNVPFYLALGILCGFYARYYVVISQKVEHFFKGLKWSAIQKAILGGAVVSLFCVAMPPLFGEGYTSVKSLASGHGETILQNSFFRYLPFESWMLVAFTGCVCLLKAFAASFTIQSGGNGGNFAPSLFAGGFLGFFFAVVCQQLGLDNIPVTNLVIVGMGGVMAGVMYAPLTAIFLIAESSSGYDLFIPLMIVATISYLMAKWFSPISPELQKLAKEGKVFTRAHDKNILLLLKMDDLIEKDFQHVSTDATLREVVELFKAGNKNIIAVNNKDNLFTGIIAMDDIRPVLFEPALYDTVTVPKLMQNPKVVVNLKDSINVVIKKFEEADVWNLPVVQDKKLVGFISKSSILNKYRALLQEYSEA
ncbi:chloride channel protein, CIC family [Chitinophaga terrae (ex Kim and Jung 2007)]|uniref:Chloride channel protein, CIC family n=1 Tax=Chitinophaga terrae (ex Kim and Jung 2007) TaxID=408074 RepID=A0A1H4DXG9_9BACT|nr:chloride channel protein [Chitinophaga terrae (ex Kim and Jung 2007)]GEP91303.1 transporter [Chitinophaga terrae (ex Kim and Jung 2007)]SEA77189.1 chloride channel protein, CIC family [Chitinophaga terrae (ex Kim and Jung 2007)]